MDEYKVTLTYWPIADSEADALNIALDYLKCDLENNKHYAKPMGFEITVHAKGVVI